MCDTSSRHLWYSWPEGGRSLGLAILKLGLDSPLPLQCCTASCQEVRIIAKYWMGMGDTTVWVHPHVDLGEVGGQMCTSHPCLQLLLPPLCDMWPLDWHAPAAAPGTRILVVPVFV